jgi:hypothetical protein
MNRANKESEIKDAVSEVDVYSRPECIFQYCPSPQECKSDNMCKLVKSNIHSGMEEEKVRESLK